MKSIWIVIFGTIGIAIAYVFFGKNAKATSVTGAGVGGCVPNKFVGPLTSQQGTLPKCGDTSDFQLNQVKNNNGLIWNPDQKTYNTAPDSSFFAGAGEHPINVLQPLTPPINIYNPPPLPPDLSVIGTPGGVAGTAAGITYPQQVPPPPGNDPGVPTTDLSPTFWAADSVPPNPYLDNGLTGPTYTA